MPRYIKIKRRLLKIYGMNTKNFVGTIASLIGSANDKHFTLDAVEVMEFVDNN